jgi:nucleoside-diphosphate-sugar epimerase
MTSKKTALIGYTGFVGGNLMEQYRFDALYRSVNIEEIKGSEFDLVICAGAPAEKWKANQEPEKDARNIHRLIDCLSEVKAGRFVLISTVDVYKNPVNVDEDTVPSAEGLHPYGAHRLELENFVRGKFTSNVLRLPGLFGRGLKKNVIYDFIHSNNVDRIHSQSQYQFYDLAFLKQDIDRAIQEDIQVLNLSAEPISVQELAASCFQRKFDQMPDVPVARYDFKSKYSSAWGSKEGYLYSKAKILERIGLFCRAYAK